MSQMIAVADCKHCCNLQKTNEELRKTHDEILSKMIERTAFLGKFYDQFPEHEDREILQKVRDEVQQEKKRFEEEMAALKKKNESLEARIATQEMSAARLRQELTEAQKKIVELEEEIESDSDEDDEDEECSCEEDERDCYDSSDEDEEEDSSEESLAARAHLQEELDKAVKKADQLAEENVELRTNGQWLEDELKRIGDILFSYIARYPQFVQHKTLEEAQAEINDLRCKVAFLEEEKKSQLPSEADDWEEVESAEISGFSETTPDSSVFMDSDYDTIEEETVEDAVEEDAGAAVPEAKKDVTERNAFERILLICVFFFTFQAIRSVLTMFF